jgi:SAM-dependent methyltransferase
VEILECRHCGLAWWRPPEDFQPEAIYDAGYFADSGVGRGYDDYAALAHTLRRTFARRMRGIPRPGEGARLLDVGAAYGFAVAEACGAGWDACGIEISPSAARRAALETGGRVAVASALAAPFRAETFDAVTLWDVLEHLPEPRSVLEQAQQLLRPGGRLVLTTGDVGSLLARASGPAWHLYTLPEHLFFFSRPSLRQLLSRSGFVVEEMRSESAYYTLSYLVERLRKTLLGRSASGVPSWPGAGLGIPVNLFDIVRVTARRR